MGKQVSCHMKLYNTLTAIQVGNEPDPFGWVVEVEQETVNKTI